MKRFASAIFVATVTLCLLACEKKPKPEEGPASSAASVATASPPATLPSPSPSSAHPLTSGPLTIAYSDWPGWVAWDIAVERGFFKDAGVDVKLEWLEYVPSMEAFSEGKADAVCMTNGDALVSASGGAQSVGILLNDFSNGNDMIVAKSGIQHVADLKGKKIGVEVGFVDHLLLMEALKAAHLSESDVDIVNEKTQKTPQLLKSGGVAAIVAWQPNSGEALDLVPGSKAIFTSKDVPGLIYDLLFVSPKSLKEHRAEWKKVVGVWFRVAKYIQDPKTRADAVKIMSARVKLSPEKYGKLTDGTFILDAEGNKKHFARGPTFESVYGSTAAVDKFNVDNHTYKEPGNVESILDPSLMLEVAGGAPP